MRLRLLSSATLTGVISGLFSTSALATTCTEAPDCLSLGYTLTASDCPKGYIKCPWNTGLVYCKCSDEYQYTCDGANEVAGSEKCGAKYKACGCASGYTWGNGGCVQEKCKIGDIYYTDNSYSSELVAGKTVLGIVVHVTDDGKHGQIMAPWSIDKSGKKTSSNSTQMVWGGYGTNISSLTDYQSRETAAKDYDSCGNTDKIVAAGDASTYPAAWATRKYAPTTATSGKWCLPAGGIMYNIYNNQDAIQTALSKAGGITFPKGVWSSSEYGAAYAWYSYLTPYLDYTAKEHSNTFYVRPVLEF